MENEKDIVIGIDSSTTATKAIGWTRDGLVAGIGRCPIPLSNPGQNLYEQNPEDWWSSAKTAIRQLLEQVSPERIAALSIANQRETFVPLDKNAKPVRQAIVWLDQRCSDEVTWLSKKVGHGNLHRISGKPPDMAPVAYRIAWMLRSETELFHKTKIFADVHSYLTWQLTGEFQTSWASADPLGMFDMENKFWSPEILQALELSFDQLPKLVAPCNIIGEVSSEAAEQTGLLPGTLVVSGGGDGQAAGLGVNALNSSRAYLNLGTAVVSGTYSKEYRTSMAWRTMGSCSGEGYYYETSLRSGTFLIEWFVRQVCQACENDKEIYNRLEEQASNVSIGSEGLLLLPYWGAVMTPYWNPLARGCWLGFSGSHQIGHMYRSLLEGIALEQMLVTGMIEEQTSEPIKDFVTIGGGASSDLWRQIIADVSGKKVLCSETVEASSLGAAICAATAIGWYSNAESAAKTMAGKITKVNEPISQNVTRYAELMKIYRTIYPSLNNSFQQLSDFVKSS
ncbi:MAG: FGGY-family carbohydrate kinase [Sedimentisphaerales bacterium]|nr:FGGY-family carbohydrate kinase [Sedimentisphaerales bacterium]